MQLFPSKFFINNFQLFLSISTVTCVKIETAFISSINRNGDILYIEMEVNQHAYLREKATCSSSIYAQAEYQEYGNTGGIAIRKISAEYKAKSGTFFFLGD